MRMKCVIGEGVLRGMIRVGLMERILREGKGGKYRSVMEFLKEMKEIVKKQYLGEDNVKSVGQYLYSIWNEYRGEKGDELGEALKVILGTFNRFIINDEIRKKLSGVFGIGSGIVDVAKTEAQLDQMDLDGLYKGLWKHTYWNDQKRLNKELLGFLNRSEISELRVSITGSHEKGNKTGNASGLSRNRNRENQLIGLNSDILNRLFSDAATEKDYKKCAKYINDSFKNLKSNDIIQNIHIIKLNMDTKYGTALASVMKLLNPEYRSLYQAAINEPYR